MATERWVSVSVYTRLSNFLSKIASRSPSTLGRVLED